jgi:hypothetical protein
LFRQNIIKRYQIACEIDQRIDKIIPGRNHNTKAHFIKYVRGQIIAFSHKLGRERHFAFFTGGKFAHTNSCSTHLIDGHKNPITQAFKELGLADGRVEQEFLAADVVQDMHGF